jgi:hypothetical protein
MIEKLPEQWCVRVEENSQPEIIREWRTKQKGHENQWRNKGYLDNTGYYYTNNKPDVIEISLNDFKKLVLGENISENYDYLIKLLKTLKIK